MAPIVANVKRKPPKPRHARAMPEYRTANWTFDGALHKLNPTSPLRGLKESNVAVEAKRMVPCKS